MMIWEWWWSEDDDDDDDDDDGDDDDDLRAKRGGLKHVSPTHAETYAGILHATV